jgi:hypothetical protein
MVGVTSQVSAMREPPVRTEPHPTRSLLAKTTDQQFSVFSILERPKRSLSSRHSGLTTTSTVPPGRAASLHRYPGSSRLATIWLSPRDENHSTIEAPGTKLALMGLKPWANFSGPFGFGAKTVSNIPYMRAIRVCLCKAFKRFKIGLIFGAS